MRHSNRLLLAGAVAAVSVAAGAKGGASGTHPVAGYVKGSGTVVQPHMQTNPNGMKIDNWSSKPNVNPYTGKAGTVDPLKEPVKGK